MTENLKIASKQKTKEDRQGKRVQRKKDGTSVNY